MDDVASIRERLQKYPHSELDWSKMIKNWRWVEERLKFFGHKGKDAAVYIAGMHLYVMGLDLHACQIHSCANSQRMLVCSQHRPIHRKPQLLVCVQRRAKTTQYLGWVSARQLLDTPGLLPHARADVKLRMVALEDMQKGIPDGVLLVRSGDESHETA